MDLEEFLKTEFEKLNVIEIKTNYLIVEIIECIFNSFKRQLSNSDLLVGQMNNIKIYLDCNLESKYSILDLSGNVLIDLINYKNEIIEFEKLYF